MSLPGPALGDGVAEWAGRLLVTLQFGLLACIGWRAWNAPLAAEILALCLLAGSAGLGFWTLAANRPGNFNIRPTPRDGGTLVTSGPYQWIRHPMYTAVLLAAAGAAAVPGQPLDAVLWLTLLGVLAAKAVIEERALRVRFPGYGDYMRQTTRFLPWLA
jgi:protein-S-isoprenylcysteine O-methyltransferase Ste14